MGTKVTKGIQKLYYSIVLIIAIAYSIVHVRLIKVLNSIVLYSSIVP